ncbi:hypothetical protein N1F78_12105 [Seonamhaeicola sp. MEBiC1930]|uniref:hypothetical protein n=1 Tax=Seonamhaeicola sp. MEBiC01930 TaxID=2976768 RepID=UPI003245C99E
MKPQQRITDPKKIDKRIIDEHIKSGKHVIVQFSQNSFNRKMLTELNQLSKKYSRDFGIRFFGHYGKSFDLKNLEIIPDVKCLYIDCLMEAKNIEYLKNLEYLEKLSIGIFELKETEVLSYQNLWNVEELFLTETRTKAFNLEHLKNFKKLKFLIVGNHTKNIDSIGHLENLETLYLNSIKKVSISFINKLKKLKTLKFTLGGRENIKEIGDNKIEDLEITWVRGFNDLSNISNFSKLKKLFIQDNIKLEKIKFYEKSESLKSLIISNCKTLNELTGLDKLTNLETLTIYKTNIDFDNFFNSELPKSLKTLIFGTSKIKTDKIIKEKILEKGYETR